MLLRHSQNPRVLATGLAALLFGAVPTFGQTKTVQYYIHETPTDPSSPITLKVSLWLQEEQVEGNSAAWRVVMVELRQPRSAGGPDRVWLAEEPYVDTPDGLWWVEHEDPSDPKHYEFVLPPNVIGTAKAEDPNDPDVQYDIAGVPYSEPLLPDTPPYETTVALNYVLILLGDPLPLQEGEEEPAELPPDNEPSGGN
jgi:hypothetical protein